MDVFKLLARSTNLQKSTHTSKNATQQQIPSAGFHGHRTSLTHNELNSDVKKSIARNSAKRKRDEPGISQGSGLDRFDFFGVEATNAVCSTKQSTADPYSRNLGPEMDGNINRPITKFDEMECRPIMKRHKLKATLLNPENNGHKSFPSIKPLKGSCKLLLQPLVSFQQLRTQYGLSKRLSENLEIQGYKEPTEVQMGSLPILLGSDEDRGLSQRGETNKMKRKRSDVDMLTIAPTGSGKTLAYLIHIFHGLLSDLAASKKNFGSRGVEHNVRALIIAPTHELADQISNEGRKVAFGTGLKIACMKKGMRLNTDRHHSENGIIKNSTDTPEDEISSDDAEDTKWSVVKVDVLVSTPLVLLHALSSTLTSAPITLPEVRYLVLDEADILLDPLFRSQTLGIWAACVNHALRTSLWSATIGSSIESLAQSFILGRRQELNVLTSKERPYHIIRLVVGLKDSAIPNIFHRLVYAASEQGKLFALRQLIHPAAGSGGSGLTIQPPFLVFTQTIPRAIALHSELLYDIPPEAGGSSRIAVLHSNFSEATRSAIMENFRKGGIWVLITTDLLSRGVDFRGVNGVVNYDIPNTSASYVHRVGRTGRQGREGGVAVTFYTAEDIPYVKSIANVIAASDRVHGQRHDSMGQQMYTWLMDVLPTVSKRTKKELKTKGVESRRVATERGVSTRKMRISTKSGYDRKREHRRKGAVLASRRRATEDHLGGDDIGDEEWGGIEE